MKEHERYIHSQENLVRFSDEMIEYFIRITNEESISKYEADLDKTRMEIYSTAAYHYLYEKGLELNKEDFDKFWIDKFMRFVHNNKNPLSYIQDRRKASKL